VPAHVRRGDGCPRPSRLGRRPKVGTGAAETCHSAGSASTSRCPTSPTTTWPDRSTGHIVAWSSRQRGTTWKCRCGTLCPECGPLALSTTNPGRVQRNGHGHTDPLRHPHGGVERAVIGVEHPNNVVARDHQSMPRSQHRAGQRQERHHIRLPYDPPHVAGLEQITEHAPHPRILPHTASAETVPFLRA
jgi:hypothetical protein